MALNGQRRFDVHMDTDPGEWLPVRAAAEACNMSLRTLYGYVERKALQAKTIDGRTHVRVPDVEQIAARLHAARERVQTDADKLEGKQSDGDSASAAAKQFSIADEHARVERARAEEERIRAETALERTKAEAEATQAEREQHRQERELAIHRGKLEVEHEAFRKGLERQRAANELVSETEAAKRKLAEQHHSAEQRRAEERNAAKHRAWVQQWVERVVPWLDEKVGIASIGQGQAAVRRALAEQTADTPDAVVEKILESELRREFRDVFDAQQRDQEALARLDAIRAAWQRHERHLAPEHLSRVRSQCQQTASQFARWTNGAERAVFESADAEARICRAEQEERRLQDAEAAKWARLYAGLPSTVRARLPGGTPGSELDRVLREIQVLYRERPSSLTHADFERLVREHVDAAAEVIGETLRKNRWQAIEADLPRLVDRQLSADATAQDRSAAIDELRAIVARLRNGDPEKFHCEVSNAMTRMRRRIRHRREWSRMRVSIDAELTRVLVRGTEDEIEEARREIDELAGRLDSEERHPDELRSQADRLLHEHRKRVEARRFLEAWQRAREGLRDRVERLLPDRATDKEVAAVLDAIRERIVNAEDRTQTADSFLRYELPGLVDRLGDSIRRRLAVDDALSTPGVTQSNREALRRVAEREVRFYSNAKVAADAAYEAVRFALRHGQV